VILSIRGAHYLKQNEAVRFPHRWVVLDTEAHTTYDGPLERQHWRLGVACRWRDDTKRDAEPDYADFTDPADLWGWVAEWTKPGYRTVLWCHNLSYDLRISRAFHILPKLGWELEWCNLDRQVSTARWRRGKATLLMCDLFTWAPWPLERIGRDLGIDKPDLPDDDESEAAWLARCRADVEITTGAVQQLLGYLKGRELGSWQPSGAGMSWAWWRHKHLTHRILVHDDNEALEAEREAMHTGRCEAYLHGDPVPGRWTEWDMNVAYLRVAREAQLPARLCAVYDDPGLDLYKLSERYHARLCRVQVKTEVPVLPTHHGDVMIWPVGEFSTTVWDVELDEALAAGASVVIDKMWCYRRAPFLASWAEETFALLESPPPDLPPVVRLWLKHQSRALIGRLAVRYPSWEPFGANPEDWCGLSKFVDLGEASVTRMLALGDKTWLETAPAEGENSLPQATGWIMAACRVRLWRTLQALDPATVAYCDTDSIVVNSRGSRDLAAFAEAHPEYGWRRKRSDRKLRIWGPRQLEFGGATRLSGVPKRAERQSEGIWRGAVWQSLAAALETGTAGSVVVTNRSWQIAGIDRRRSGGPDGPTEPYRLAPASESVAA
jgi:hypothetical protein